MNKKLDIGIRKFQQSFMLQSEEFRAKFLALVLDTMIKAKRQTVDVSDIIDVRYNAAEDKVEIAYDLSHKEERKGAEA